MYTICTVDIFYMTVVNYIYYRQYEVSCDIFYALNQLVDKLFVILVVQSTVDFGISRDYIKQRLEIYYYSLKY